MLEIILRVQKPKWSLGDFVHVPVQPMVAGGIVRIERVTMLGEWTWSSDRAPKSDAVLVRFSYACSVQRVHFPNGDEVKPGTVWIIDGGELERSGASASWEGAPIPPEHAP